MNDLERNLSEVPFSYPVKPDSPFVNEAFIFPRRGFVCLTALVVLSTRRSSKRLDVSEANKLFLEASSCE